MAGATEPYFLDEYFEQTEPVYCRRDMSDELLELEESGADVATIRIETVDDAYNFALNAHMLHMPVSFYSDSGILLFGQRGGAGDGAADVQRLRLRRLPQRARRANPRRPGKGVWGDGAVNRPDRTGGEQKRKKLLLSAYLFFLFDSVRTMCYSDKKGCCDENRKGGQMMSWLATLIPLALLALLLVVVVAAVVAFVTLIKKNRQ